MQRPRILAARHRICLCLLRKGITQDLVSTLSQLPNLKVVSLASAYRYKGKAIDPPTVARELGVHTILTGRMLQRNDNVSISAELVDAEHDRVMWSSNTSGGLLMFQTFRRRSHRTSPKT